MKVIGALHLLPLVGYEGFTSFADIVETAQGDLDAFQEGGVDEVIVENNYNLPHRIEESSAAIAMMTHVIQSLEFTVPFGISLLWNDFKGALTIAKATDASFIRVPVFVDSVETDFGRILAKPEAVIELRKQLGLENVKVLADVQVKHAHMLQKRSLAASVQAALVAGADGIIITGSWTGDPPDMQMLSEARSAAGDIPLFVGSGAEIENIRSLPADAVIVSSSLKDGKQNHLRNVHKSGHRISLQKVKDFVRVAKVL